jgi:hypothetical protein
MDFHQVNRKIYLTDFVIKSHIFLFQFSKAFRITDLDLLKMDLNIYFKVSIIAVIKKAFQTIYGFWYGEQLIIYKVFWKFHKENDWNNERI